MRTKRSLYNFITSYIPYAILILLGFVKIKVFINILGQDLYALNQLYTNIFSYLTLAEARVGVAFIFRLYKLLAHEKHEEINAIYSGTKILFKNRHYCHISWYHFIIWSTIFNK